jgi:hypothetical protein
MRKSVRRKSPRKSSPRKSPKRAATSRCCCIGVKCPCPSGKVCPTKSKDKNNPVAKAEIVKREKKAQKMVDNYIRYLENKKK